MGTIRAYERGLIGPLLEGLGSVPGLRIYGITDPDRFADRVPTVAFTVRGLHPRRMAEHLAARAINAWDGNYYAIELLNRLGLDDSGGTLRVGLVHYNIREEIDRLVEALHELTGGSR
jgi:selenocysteine lyase/cysteine desulfurase